MKRSHLLSLLVTSALVGKLACSPPVPRENQPLSSVEGPDDDNGQGGQGGNDNQSPDVEVPVGLGGADPGEDVCGAAPAGRTPFSKRNMLSSLAECAAWRLCQFEDAAKLLSTEAKSYVDAPSADSEATLKKTYFEAMQRWSRVELFQFGPLASKTQDPRAGAGLRDLIYSWPNVSRCRVEEQVFGQAYKTKGFDNLVQVPLNSRGLFAVEYLVFYKGTDNACSQFSITNANNAWNNTSPEDLTARKREYLVGVTADIRTRATQLSEEYAIDGGNFIGELADASAYMDQQEALNLVAHALLYLEVHVKDYKVGAPAGLYTNAPVERPEADFSLGATVLLKRNLEGFADMFLGCAGVGLGYEDWLIAAGHEDLAADIREALAKAQTYLETFPDLSVATNAELLELHAHIKALSDLLKTDLFGQGSPLGLTLPTSVEGDTD